MTGDKFYSIPNLLSLSRLVLVPVLIGLAVLGEGDAFLVLLAVSLLTDAFDGYLARKLNQTSELGARLDSWGDVLTYGAIVFALYWLWPDIFNQQAAYLMVAILSYLVPVALAIRKFGEYPSYHTWAAKATAVLMAPAFYVLTLTANDLLFRGVILFHVLVAFEEMAITAMLDKPKTNVRSVFHLDKQLKREESRE